MWSEKKGGIKSYLSNRVTSVFVLQCELQAPIQKEQRDFIRAFIYSRYILDVVGYNPMLAFWRIGTALPTLEGNNGFLERRCLNRSPI